MAYNQTLGYDPDFDYNKAISEAKDANYIKELQKEQSNKINRTAAYVSKPAIKNAPKASIGAYMSYMKKGEKL